jgi:hypothetical protein
MSLTMPPVEDIVIHVDCACSSPEHEARFVNFPGEPEVYFSVQLREADTFVARLGFALRYLFGRRVPAYCEIVTTKQELQAVIDQLKGLYAPNLVVVAASPWTRSTVSSARPFSSGTL